MSFLLFDSLEEKLLSPRRSPASGVRHGREVSAVRVCSKADPAGSLTGRRAALHVRAVLKWSWTPLAA